jgi:hypothetical protein
MHLPQEFIAPLAGIVVLLMPEHESGIVAADGFARDGIPLKGHDLASSQGICQANFALL